MTTRKKILSLFCFIICITSCYEPEEGCLDTFANNYDVTADQSCEDCCTYPSLTLRVTHAEGELPFVPDSLLLDALGNTYALRQVEFFVSDFSVLMSDGKQLEVADSILLTLNGSSQYYKRDIKHVSLGRSSYNLGKLSSDGTVVGYSFYVGMDPLLNSIDFANLSSSFVLKQFEDSLYINDAFVDMQIEMERDTALHDTITMDIADMTFYQKITLDYNLEIEKGKDIILPVKIDYQKWFDGLNAKVDDELTLGQLLAANTQNAFIIP